MKSQSRREEIHLTMVTRVNEAVVGDPGGKGLDKAMGRGGGTISYSLTPISCRMSSFPPVLTLLLLGRNTALSVECPHLGMPGLASDGQE